MDDLDTIMLTTDHSASSYGIPVLLIDGNAYGPADVVPGTDLTAADLVRQWADRFCYPPF